MQEVISQMQSLSRLLRIVPLVTAMSTMAHGQSTVIPYAAEEVEHDSNIFYLPSNFPVPQGNGGPTFADNWLRSLAGLDATYLWDRQKFFATAEVRRFDYDHFSYLDHTEVLVHAGMDWQLTNLLDGVIDYRHERSAVPFQDLVDSTQLFLQTEDVGSASINVHVSPEWLLETQAKYRELDSPRPQALDLSLHESSVEESARYLGVAHLSAGLDLKYLNGQYENDPSVPTLPYHQGTAQLAAEYDVAGLTRFNGAVGYTRRSQIGGDVSGITGAIGYQQQITGKTSIDLELNRAVNSYITTAGSEVDSSASLMFVWRATYKINVNAGYTWTENNYPQTPLLAGVPLPAVDANRVDHVQLASMEVDYQILHWLSVRSYARYQTRHSNLEDFQYNATSFGIEFQARQSKFQAKQGKPN
jgi:hypothetical protein